MKPERIAADRAKRGAGHAEPWGETPQCLSASVPKCLAAGFTLIEVLIAMAILLGALMIILGIFMQNLRFARMAREEIIVSMIQRDLQARNHVVALARAGQERAFIRGMAGADGNVESPPSFDQFGSPRDGWSGLSAVESPPGPLKDASETTDAAQIFKVGWGVRNITAWEQVSGLHWGISTPPAETDVHLFENFYFTVHPVWRYAKPDYPWLRLNCEPGSADEWDPAKTKGFPGLALEDSQFTDWDGYRWVDMDGDGVPETDRGLPSPSPGPIFPAAAGGDFAAGKAYAGNPYRIFYNSDKMRNYVLRLRVRVMWDVKAATDIFCTDAWLEDREDEGSRIFSHNTYYFSVFNSDVVKRWQEWQAP